MQPLALFPGGVCGVPGNEANTLYLESGSCELFLIIVHALKQDSESLMFVL